jgi:hypothetical protein
MIRVVADSFFSATLEVCFSKFPITTSEYGIRKIVQVNGPTDIYFTVPYVSNVPYEEVKPGGIYSSMGLLRITALDVVSSGDTASWDIYLIIYRSAGPDMQFSRMSAPFISLSEAIPQSSLSQLWSNKAFDLLGVSGSSPGMTLDSKMVNPEDPPELCSMMKKPEFYYRYQSGNYTLFSNYPENDSQWRLSSRGPFSWSILFPFWRGSHRAQFMYGEAMAYGDARKNMTVGGVFPSNGPGTFWAGAEFPYRSMGLFEVHPWFSFSGKSPQMYLNDYSGNTDILVSFGEDWQQFFLTPPSERKVIAMTRKDKKN